MPNAHCGNAEAALGVARESDTRFCGIQCTVTEELVLHADLSGSKVAALLQTALAGFVLRDKK